MSCQANLDAIEAKTGLTPRELIEMAADTLWLDGKATQPGQ